MIEISIAPVTPPKNKTESVPMTALSKGLITGLGFASLINIFLIILKHCKNGFRLQETHTSLKRNSARSYQKTNEVIC